MAQLSVLRETLRSQVGDLVRLSKDRRFTNEYLERNLFDGIQRYDKSLTWATLPPEKEQLILILAKIGIARDKALEYALDPKMTAGPNLARDKGGSSALLMQMVTQLEDSYNTIATDLETQGQDGDIVVGTLIRRSTTTGTQTPAQMVPRPSKPVIANPSYLYDFEKQIGYVRFYWPRSTDGNLAMVRVYLSRNPVLGPNDEIIRTIYDLYGDVLMVEPPANIILSPALTNVQLASEWFTVEKTILPSGKWYLFLGSYNWNMLHNVSDGVAFDATPFAGMTLDMYTLDDVAP